MARAMSVLLIEDSAADALLVQETVREADAAAFAFVHETSLAAGLARVGREPFDALLLDLSLPDSHGLATFLQARERLPRTPILLMTGLADQQMAIQAVHAGAQDYLVKGRVDGETIARALRYAVERQRLASDLEASEASFRNLAQNADGVVVLSPQGVVLYANPAAEALLGPGAQRAPDVLSAARLHEGAVFDSEIRGGAEATVVEARVVAASWHDAPAFLASLRDVTARKRAEDRLRDLHRRFSTLLEVSLDPFITIGLDGAITGANEALEHATGRSRAELVTLQLADIVAEPDVARAALAEAIERGSVRDRLMSILHAEGGATEVLFNASVYHDAGGAVEGVFAAARDISALRKLERETLAQRDAMLRGERLAALGVLVAGVAHEINNPLTYIGGNIECAIADLDDLAAQATREGRAPPADIEAIRKGLRTALDGASRIGHITKALKTVSRKSERRHELLDLVEVARAVAALVGISSKDHLHLQLDVPDAPLHVMGDPAEIHQVLLNLTRNAAEAVEPRGDDGRVRIAVTTRDEQAVVTVTDNGPGISVEARKMLFTPFFTTKPAGTGLGLSISLSIIRDHGGDLLVDDPDGEPGARLRLTLPLARVARVA